MAASQYLMPKYINFDMISRQLRVGQVEVVYDEEIDKGIYIEQVNTLMANAESYIINTVLSNYVAVPLVTVYDTPFDDLYNYPEYQETYVQIRATFIAMSLLYIYQEYFSFGGEGNNGEALIKQQQRIVTNFTNMAMRLDQSGNLQYKNIFNGLRPCANASQRIAKVMGTPAGMKTGTSISDTALESVPDLRRNLLGNW